MLAKSEHDTYARNDPLGFTGNSTANDAIDNANCKDVNESPTVDATITFVFLKVLYLSMFFMQKNKRSVPQWKMKISFFDVSTV